MRCASFDAVAGGAGTGASVDEADNESAVRLSRLAAAGVASTIALTVGWFLVSWVVLNSPVVDALGEALGGVALVLVLVSIFGALLRSR